MGVSLKSIYKKFLSPMSLQVGLARPGLPGFFDTSLG